MSATRFIGEPISVEYDKPPLLSKRPRCPNRIRWRGETVPIVEKLAEWQDFRRRGRLAQNMRPERLPRARKQGSWGVGRFYYRVELADGRIVDIYYDRAPQDADRRSGGWHLFRQILADTDT